MYNFKDDHYGYQILPAPCLRSSAAEFVAVCADESLTSSMGSKENETKD